MGAGSFAVNTNFRAKDGVSPAFGSMIKGAGRFENRLARLTRQSQGFGSCIQGTMQKMNTLMNGFIGLVALSRIKQFADSATAAAEKQLSAEQKLQQVLKNNASIRLRGSDEYLKVSKDLFEYASKMQQKGVLGDEVILGGMQTLGSMGFDDKVIKRMTPIIADLAVQQKGYNATIQDTEQIAKGLGRALAGNAGALGRMGIILNKTQKKQLENMTAVQRSEYLYKLLSSRVGGLNEQFAQTDRGAKIQFFNNLGDRLEDIGKRMIPIEGRLYRFLNKQTPGMIQAIDKIFNTFDYALNALQPVGEKFSELIKYLAENLFPELAGNTPLIKNLFENALIPGLVLVIDTVIKVCDVIGGLYNGFKNVFSFVQDNFIPLFLTFATILGGILIYNINQVAWGLLGMIVRFQSLAAAIAWNTICVWADVTALLAQAAAFALSPVGLITIAIVALIAVITLLWKNWDKVTETVVNWWNNTKTALSQFWEICKSVFGKIGSFIKEHFIDMLLWALGPIGWVIQGIKNIAGAVKKLKKDRKEQGNIDLPDYRGGNDGKGGNNTPPVKTYPQTSSGTVTVKTTIDNKTTYPAKTSTNVTEQNNMTLVPG